ncbi:MAG: DUF2520 domain-containing protein [Gemmatimonadota bacterium]
MSLQRVAILGPGRMGQGIGLGLFRAGWIVTLVGRAPKVPVVPLPLVVGNASGVLDAADLILVTTPDDGIPAAADSLAASGAVTSRQVVLHCSGRLDRSALAVLEPSGAALGSFHPLQTVADPLRAPDLLRGAFAGVEGDEAAVAMAGLLAGALGMSTVVLPTGGKAGYHAAAVIIGNYITALVGFGERIAIEAGIPSDLATRIYFPLLAGAVNNLGRLRPAEALTGVVRRGDLASIRAHLETLSSDQDRVLYARLGLEALRLAVEAGLAREVAQQIQALFEQGLVPPP